MMFRSTQVVYPLLLRRPLASLMTCCQLRLATGHLPKVHIAFVECFFTRNYAIRLAAAFLLFGRLGVGQDTVFVSFMIHIICILHGKI